jgi:serine/threonine protein phosphatase PrpC
MHARGFGLAHVGRKRETNEDCWLADDQLGLYVVADGMGGHRGGEVAAAAAVTAVAQFVRSRREILEKVQAGARPKQLGLVVENACQAAARAVFEEAREDPRNKGMGCTLTVLLLVRGWAVMGHVGDSRLYLCRRGQVHQLSDDHTYAAELARHGAIEPSQVKGHSYAHVLTQSVGAHPTVQPDVLCFQLLPEDRLLLCSDGLSNYLDDTAWLAEELAEEDAEGVPAELVRHANEAGGADNITAVVVEVEAEPDAPTLQQAELAEASLDALQACFLFAGLSLARKAWTLTHCVLREESPGPIVEAGAPLPGLFVVVEGEAGVDGERLGPGEHWGVTALVSPRAARKTVSAGPNTRTLLLTAERFRTLTRSRPRLGVLLLRRLAAGLSQALEGRPSAAGRDPAPPALGDV